MNPILFAGHNRGVSLANRVADTGLILPGARVLVGYSGGADSTALLTLLHELGVTVVAAHLHHGMRPEADQEADQCRSYAESLGIEFAMGRADVPAIAHDRGIGIEEAGRLARYEFFHRAARQFECAQIATGHTADDQAETVLLHLARGSGLRGLRGIPEERDGIIRPLLRIGRAETRAFCAERGLWFHDDPANSDGQFSRVRVRTGVIPVLEALQAGAVDRIARTSRLIAEEDSFLDSVAAANLEPLEVQLNGELSFLTRDVEVALQRVQFQSLPPVLARRSVRLVAGVLGADPEFDQVEAALEAVRLSGSVTFSGGNVVWEVSGEMIHARILAVDAPFRYPVTLPGETFADEFGWFIRAQSAEPLPYPTGGLSQKLDARQVQGGLHFRSAEPGDRMEPLGLGGSKKIHDLMADAKLTQAARRRLPVIWDMVGPVWVPGLAVADRVRISEATERAILLVFGPLSSEGS